MLRLNDVFVFVYIFSEKECFKEIPLSGGIFCLSPYCAEMNRFICICICNLQFVFVFVFVFAVCHHIVLAIGIVSLRGKVRFEQTRRFKV